MQLGSPNPVRNEIKHMKYVNQFHKVDESAKINVHNSRTFNFGDEEGSLPVDSVA